MWRGGGGGWVGGVDMGGRGGLLSHDPSDRIHPRCRRRADQSDAASGGFLTADISGLRCAGGLPLTHRSGGKFILVMRRK